MIQVKSNIVIIDSRAAGYEGEAVRVLAITMADSGKVLIEKLANWHEPVKRKDNVAVVTDTPNIFNHWSQAFREQEHMKDLVRTYLEVKRSGLIKINDSIKMYDPIDIVQTAKMDERGQVQEFDDGITNGHMAVLMAIWVARRVYGGYVLTEVGKTQSDSDYDDGDGDLMPFSI